MNTHTLRLPMQIRGWHLWLTILVCEGIITWYFQSYILTREAYQALWAEQLDIQRIDDLFEFYRRIRTWGYVVIPVVTWFKIALIALLLQMPLVFRFIDVPFRDLFRITALAALLMIAQQVVSLARFASIEATSLQSSDLSYVPFSLINLLEISPEATVAYAFFSHFNLFEAGWLYLIYQGLVMTGKIKKLDASLVVLIVWAVLLVLQWGIVLYVNRMNS